MSSARLDDRGVVMSCPSCGRPNRIAFTRLDKQAQCGQCHAAIPPVSVPVDVTDTKSFDAALNTSVIPLVVDFWAPWCGPCRMVAPELERLARQNAGKWLVVKLNTDANPDLAGRYRIQSIPTLAVMHRGREVARVSGARSAADIERFVADALAAEHRRAS
jgi:thioredoxin 2